MKYIKYPEEIKALYNEYLLRKELIMQKPILTVCCICGRCYKSGVLIDGRVSHGYCPECAAMQLDLIKRATEGGKDAGIQLHGITDDYETRRT